jgi:peptide/nickel transport system ATP-binding protein/oligopeptide transport system ATP-binding protein
MSEQPLLEVRDLRVHYPRPGSGWFRKLEPVKAVDGVSFSIPRGKTVGLVGESGSGKTTTGRAIVKLAPVTSGRILWEGMDIAPLGNREFLPWRKKVQMVFQDPYGSLNPRADILAILSEPLEIHFPGMSRSDREARCADLLRKVGLSPEQMRRHPHEFSGGQRQRIGIARALAVQPELIVCDEPVSALDVSVQASVVNLLQDLQDELGVAYLFIAHDLAVVEHISHHILVMERGVVVEQGSPERILGAPEHPYTRTLLEAVPRF